MNPALSRLASVKPSDTSGAVAKNRFDYQRDWILCRMLDLFEAGHDFIVVCDYHDDVLVLDANPACSAVDFFQVKTASADRFTLGRLLSRKKLKDGSGPSILGKLYAHRFTFPGIVGSTTLVTNLHPVMHAENPPSIEDRVGWNVLDLADEDQETIRERLSHEFFQLGSVSLDESLKFERSPLPVTGHGTFALGLLTEFLHRFDGEGEHPVRALYRAVVDEIDRRSGREGAFETSDEIVLHKCVTKPMFDGVLRRCIELSNRGLAGRVEQLVREELIRSGLSPRRTMAVCNAVRSFAIERVDAGKLRLARLSDRAKAFWADPNESEHPTVTACMVAGAAVLRNLPESRGASDEYLMAIVAWEMFDDRGSTTTPTQLEDETR